MGRPLTVSLVCSVLLLAPVLGEVGLEDSTQAGDHHHSHQQQDNKAHDDEDHSTHRHEESDNPDQPDHSKHGDKPHTHRMEADLEQRHMNKDGEVSGQFAGIPSSTWLAALGSITLISMVGLLAVGALPLLKGPHQDTILQGLVSLAVGTLVGDSLIHLVPHAVGAEHGDTSVVWKGFTATLTIVAFFVLDRGLAAMGHQHSHGEHSHHRHSHGGHSQQRDEEEASSSCSLSRDSSPDPIIKEDKLPKISVASKTSGNSGDSGLVVGSEGSGSLYSLYRHSYHSLARGEPGTVSGGHTRTCCSMSSSSLMVIVGDGVHNFADGLAVGAAFSLSLAAGFSTSVAVLCHELPHEVGDFALLLTQGMSARTAIFYNCVSSVFAGLGLLVGLLLGAQGEISSWLLSATVGVFLYVALVSMMTELRGGGFKGLLLNTAGMISGAVLLLFIGLYEHDLILLFEPGSSHQH